VVEEARAFLIALEAMLALLADMGRPGDAAQRSRGAAHV
jgi:hypothetical protein